MRHLVITLSALALAGCQDSGICVPPPDHSDTKSPWILTAEDCIHREAYKLAKSSDASQKVSEAVVTACDSAVAPYVAEEGKKALDLALSSNFKPWDAYAESDKAEKAALTKMLDTALFRVVQARAGKCRAKG